MKPSTIRPARATTQRERSTTPTSVTRAANRNGSRIEPITDDETCVMPVNGSWTR
ncbi:hypothetical protein ACFY8O_05380 [Streptomyces argenteolus]|uniref:ATP-grasp target RiPP n=1 Tax=Streptomyces argenteolus TaxID=67274 RepID=A0ABW6X0N7_9ACTN